MTGQSKKMNYSETYVIRIDKKTKQRIKKIGARRVREILQNI
jgi:hypothetical protein